MLFKRFHQRGQGALEYVSLIALILIAFFVFQKYLVRGFVGRWKATGDTFGQGRQYDPAITKNCAYYDSASLTLARVSMWYDSDCFDNKCVPNCYGVGKDPSKCLTCMISCSDAYCKDMAAPLPKVKK